MELLSKAIVIATKAHDGQIDKGGKPYILHPLSVMMKCGNYKEKIVAVLHDVIEDTDITYDDLRQEGFDEEIIEAIDSVTRRNGESYMEFIRRCKQNSIGKYVKVADLKDNMDISRIPNPTKKDYDRVEKYKKAMSELLG